MTNFKGIIFASIEPFVGFFTIKNPKPPSGAEVLSWKKDERTTFVPDCCWSRCVGLMNINNLLTIINMF